MRAALEDYRLRPITRPLRRHGDAIVTALPAERHWRAPQGGSGPVKVGSRLGEHFEFLQVLVAPSVVCVPPRTWCGIGQDHRRSQMRLSSIFHGGQLSSPTAAALKVAKRRLPAAVTAFGRGISPRGTGCLLDLSRQQRNISYRFGVARPDARSLPISVRRLWATCRLSL